VSKVRKKQSLCKFKKCDRLAQTAGFCNAHYLQKKRGQKLRPLFLTNRPIGSAVRIVYDKRKCPRPDLEGPCHIFRGGKNTNGYGKVYPSKRKSVYVHRYIWERDRGPIPAGMEVDHQCRVRACCNVDHLRVVTVKVGRLENVVGSFWKLNAAKTHCKHGHAFDAANTYVYKGHRACRACNSVRSAACKKKRRSSCRR
jgi:hypothetical protein